MREKGIGFSYMLFKLNLCLGKIPMHYCNIY